MVINGCYKIGKKNPKTIIMKNGVKSVAVMKAPQEKRLGSRNPAEKLVSESTLKTQGMDGCGFGEGLAPNPMLGGL